MKIIKAFATIKSKTDTFEEDFEVSSKEAAEDEIKRVVTNFNNTLKPGETEREFVSIDRFEEREIDDHFEDKTEFEDWGEDDWEEDDWDCNKKNDWWY